MLSIVLSKSSVTITYGLIVQPSSIGIPFLVKTKSVIAKKSVTRNPVLLGVSFVASKAVMFPIASFPIPASPLILNGTGCCSMIPLTRWFKPRHSFSDKFPKFKSFLIWMPFSALSIRIRAANLSEASSIVCSWKSREKSVGSYRPPIIIGCFFINANISFVSHICSCNVPWNA